MGKNFTNSNPERNGSPGAQLGAQILDSLEVRPEFSTKVGSRALHLATLDRTKFSIPTWFVVTKDAFFRALQSQGLEMEWKELIQEPESVWDQQAQAPSQFFHELSQRIRAFILNLSLSPAFITELESHLRRSFPPNPLLWVRPSSVDEDPEAFESGEGEPNLLAVRGITELPGAIQEIWASAFSEASLSRRKSRGIPLGQFSLAVIVEELVETDRSGMLYTLHPETGASDQIYIRCRPGLFEQASVDEIPSDTFTVQRSSGAYSTLTGLKDKKLVVSSSGSGTQLESVSSGIPTEPCLSEGEIKNLVQRGLEVERQFEQPIELEFSLNSQGQIRLLFARPARISKDAPALKGNPCQWDRMELSESFPGVTLPMTFSLLKKVSKESHGVLVNALSSSKAQAQEYQRVCESTLGFFRGRVFKNLLAQKRLQSLYPGRSMPTALSTTWGMKEKHLSPRSNSSKESFFLNIFSRLKYGFFDVPSKVLRWGHLLFQFFKFQNKLPRQIRSFESKLDSWNQVQLQNLNLSQLEKLYFEIEHHILNDGYALVLNDHFLHVFYRYLESMDASWLPEEGALRNDALNEIKGLKSREFLWASKDLLKWTSKRLALKNQILQESPERLTELYLQGELSETFCRRIRTHIQIYGERTLEEYKLESQTLSENPSPLFHYLKEGLANVREAELRPETIKSSRGKAEMRILGALRRSPRYYFKKKAIQFCLDSVRKGIQNREQFRWAQLKLNYLLRKLFLQLGKLLQAEGLLEMAEDIFYLTVDEVWDFVQGGAVSIDLWGLIDLRRQEYEEYQLRGDLGLPSQFSTWGVPYLGEREVEGFKDSGSSLPRLRGVPCSGGQVTADVHLLSSDLYSSNLQGKILVTTELNLVWTPSLAHLGGLVVERGTPLSHSAIMARELGVPMISGIPGITSQLKEGQRISIDGSSGEVSLLEPSASI